MDVHFVSGEDGDEAFIKSMTGCLSVSSVVLEEKRGGKKGRGNSPVVRISKTRKRESVTERKRARHSFSYRGVADPFPTGATLQKRLDTAFLAPQHYLSRSDPLTMSTVMKARLQLKARLQCSTTDR